MCVPLITSSFLISTLETNDARAGRRSIAARARARTGALEIGARLPTRYGEVIVVKNDGGVKNLTTYFPYGSICHTDLDLKTWLIVKRIVGEQTLLVVDFGVEITRLTCPHETETNMRYAQARKRYEDYVRALDDKFFSDLNGGN